LFRTSQIERSILPERDVSAMADGLRVNLDQIRDVFVGVDLGSVGFAGLLAGDR
jgi:hypothetical protein